MTRTTLPPEISVIIPVLDGADVLGGLSRRSPRPGRRAVLRAKLARHTGHGPAWRDPGLRVPFEPTFAAVNDDGPPMRRRVLLPVHLLVLGARWVGRLTGRG